MSWIVLILSVLAVAGSIWWVRRRRSLASDEIYAGLTPGILDPSSPTQRTKALEYDGPVAVAFTPPKDATPGLIGLVIDGEVEARDITATVVDLAVRRHLSIEVVDVKGGRKDWILRRRDGEATDELSGYEAGFVADLFHRGSEVSMTELRHHRSAAFPRVAAAISREAAKRGWYPRDPASGGRKKGKALFFSSIAGAIVCVGQAPNALGLAAGGLVLTAGGIALFDPGSRVPRTALGSAVRIQALGFKQYLATAEAGQLKFEEAAAVFSRYLPYAIVFGVADHWAKVFKDLAIRAEAEGVPFELDLGWLIAADLASDLLTMGMLGAFDGLGELIGSMDMAEGFGDLLGGIGEAAGDLVSDIGESVGDFFDGFDI